MHNFSHIFYKISQDIMSNPWDIMGDISVKLFSCNFYKIFLEMQLPFYFIYYLMINFTLDYTNRLN